MDRLIQMVKSNPCLWDTNHPSYKDFEVTEVAWAKVAEAMNYPDGRLVKLQWKKLRDNFREALKRQSDQKRSKRNIRMWRYSSHMEFLIPFMQSKGLDFTGTGNNNSLSEETSEAVKSITMLQNPKVEQSPKMVRNPKMIENPKMVQIPVVVQISKLLRNSQVVQDPMVPQISEVAHNSKLPHISEVFQNSEVIQNSDDNRQQSVEYFVNEEANDSASSFQRKRRKMTSSSTNLEDVKEEMRESKNRSVIVQGDALLNFFSSMYNTTSQLSPQLQLQVKRKIFEVVTEAEEASLMLKQEQEVYDEQGF